MARSATARSITEWQNGCASTAICSSSISIADATYIETPLATVTAHAGRVITILVIQLEFPPDFGSKDGKRRIVTKASDPVNESGHIFHREERVINYPAY